MISTPAQGMAQLKKVAEVTRTSSVVCCNMSSQSHLRERQYLITGRG